jgi:hypothetical protein
MGAWVKLKLSSAVGVTMNANDIKGLKKKIMFRITHQPHSFQGSIGKGGTPVWFWGDCEFPLHCASFYGNYDAVRMLLEHRATVDLFGVIWGTALQAA